MRLSDLIKKGSDSLDSSPRRPAGKETYKEKRIPAPSAISLIQADKLPPIQGPQPEKTESSLTPKTSGSKTRSLYDSTPGAIYQAAEQLDIPIHQNTQLVLKKAKETLSDIFAKAQNTADKKEGLWKIVKGIATDFLNILAVNANFARVIQRCSEKEDRLISHSINTALIAMDLARAVNNIEYSPLEIGTASLLHDVGIARLQLQFTWDEKDPVFRNHVTKSLEIIEEMKIPQAIKTMIAQHHERIDGSGYPNGIEGNEFLISSQVLALAETFERITCKSFENGTTEQVPGQNYVQATLAEFHNALDSDLLKVFISLRGFYPDGVMIELTNRSICLVIRQNEGFPLNPVVQVVVDSAGNHPETARIIDLRDSNTLSIIRAVTQNGDQE